MTNEETLHAMDTLNAMLKQLKNERHMVVQLEYGRREKREAYVTDEGHYLLSAITTYIHAMDLKKHINFNQVFKRIKKEVLEDYYE